MRYVKAASVATAAALIALGPAGPVSGDPGSTMTVTPTGLSSAGIYSADGRSVVGSALSGASSPAPAPVILDLKTGITTPLPSWDADHYDGFVSDNPALVLSHEHTGAAGWFPNGGVYLTDTRTGARTRIDTDSAGVPLAPSWSSDGTCQEGCDYHTYPALRLDTDAVSRDGRLAAFCANYLAPKEPVLYVKDLASGALTRTSILCGVFREGPESDTDEWADEGMSAPQISEDGRVVHVLGDRVSYRDGDLVGWQADWLYFPATGKARRVTGQGTMTRDGGTLFLRMGVQKPVPGKRAAKKVGAYSVRTKKTKRLPWWNSFYGGDHLFGVPEDMTTRRGRYLVNDTAVMDRTRVRRIDICALLRDRGYDTDPGRSDLRISMDGSVILAEIYNPAEGMPDRTETVAVTGWGWKPMVRATVTTNHSQTKLIVDVDPNKGSGYWTFAVQRRQESGTWEALPTTYKTQGRRETRTIDLPTGRYRVQVKPKHGYRGYISAEVDIAH